VWRFIDTDYTRELDVPAESFDLLVSLYAGFASEFCTRYLHVRRPHRCSGLASALWLAVVDTALAFA